MLSGLFDADNSTITKKDDLFAPISGKAKKAHAALDLDLPPIRKAKGELSGLVNQGATCYLNSLFQALYYCPEFRKFILTIDLNHLTAYEKGSQKEKLIREF